MKGFLLGIVGVICSVSARADLITFDNAVADLSPFTLITGTTATAQSAWFRAAPGVGGSVGIESWQPNSAPQEIYTRPVPTAPDGTRSTSIDFYLPNGPYNAPITIAIARPSLFAGFVDSSTSRLGGLVGTSAYLAVVADIFADGNGSTTMNIVPVATFAPVSTNPVEGTWLTVTLTTNRWYQVKTNYASREIWGSVSDIGSDGAAAPTVVADIPFSSGLSLPDGILSNSDVFAGFHDSTLLPLDNFSTPEPLSSLIGFAAAGLFLRRRGSKRSHRPERQ